MAAIAIDPPITRLHWADRIRCVGIINGWSTCCGIAWLPNDSSVRFCWCGPDCKRRGKCWYFLPECPRHMRDRGTKRYNPCSEFDVPELLRKIMKSHTSWVGIDYVEPKRYVMKDPRVSDELAALARGCVRSDGFDPLNGSAPVTR